MLWKINYANSLFVFTPENINNQLQSYKFYVGPGNNCNLIKGIIFLYILGILKRRFWWTITNNKNEDGINFMWTQLKHNSYFKLQKSGKLPLASNYNTESKSPTKTNIKNMSTNS